MDFDCTNCKHLENMIHSKVCPNCFKGDRWEPIPKTHYDEIRNMSVEEMRDEYFYILHNVLCRYTDSRGGLLMWLKEEVHDT